MLELRVLGSPHLRRAGAPAPIRLQPKRLAVLAYLALESEVRPCRRDTLVALFWPSLDEAHARNALSQALHGLRRGLGTGVVQGVGAQELRVTHGELWCDATVFEGAVTEARFQDAVELYAGPLLEGLHVPGASGFEDWLSGRRARLQRRAAEALRVLIERSERGGNWAGAAEGLRRLAELTPGDESVVRRWMRALARAGDRVGALRVYDRLAQELAVELALSPAAETRRLAERLRAPAVEEGGEGTPSIAVLPFADLSPDRDQEYFCHGLTEEVINALALEPGMRVTARTSVFAAGVRDRDVRELAGWLGVDAVLEGSVRRSGDTMRMTLQLIDGDSGHHLWSARYDRSRGEALGIQDEIAEAVASTLRERLAATRRRRGGSRTNDAEAHDLYLRGLYHRRKRTREALATACECLRQCVARDPGYADGHAALAFTHALAGWWLFDVLPPRDAYAVARSAAVRALALDNRLPEAHLALAYTRQAFDWDGPGAEVAFARALALDPDSQEILGNYAGHLVLRGRFDEAIEVTREAERLDPGWIMPPTALGLWMLAARRYDEAVAQLERAAELEPRFFMPTMFLGDCYRFTGRPAEAAARYERAVELAGREPILLGRLASAAAEHGDFRVARALVEELDALEATRHVLPSIVARAHLSMGDLDAAYRLLDRAVEVRDTTLVLLPQWPGYDPIRTDPRYDGLLDRVRLWPRGSAAPADSGGAG